MHCVDLGESFQTHIYLQKLASIQPRTSHVKFARSRDSTTGNGRGGRGGAGAPGAGAPGGGPLADTSWVRWRGCWLGGIDERDWLTLVIIVIQITSIILKIVIR